MGLFIVVGGYLTVIIGAGALVIGGTYLYEFLFRRILILLKLHGLFVEFIWERAQKKRSNGVFKPTIREGE